MKLNLLPVPQKPEPTNDVTAMDPVGFWTVFTEGDEEGRSIRKLGTHFGHFAEIAFHLADQCCHVLCFTREPVPYEGVARPTYTATRSYVYVRLGSVFDVWYKSSLDLEKHFRTFLDTDEVIVRKGPYFATVKLTLNLKETVPIS